jgi:hypothetical protein
MKSDLWTTLGEEDTGIASSGDETRSFSNFCPEATSQVFGLFASSLAKYANETDREIAEERLVRNGKAHSKDWRWNWALVAPMHYTECSTYSLLSVALNPIQVIQKEGELVSARLGFFGFSIDLRRLISRFARWWLSKNA